MEIDVSKCELIYNNNRCFGSQRQGIGNDCHKSDYCKYNYNCYYKQLQQLKTERDLLLNQLVVLDGEDVTVQVTQDQFEEYNKLKADNEGLQSLNDFNVQKIETLEAENEELKEQIKSNGFGMFNIQMAQCLDEIEGICKSSLHCDSCYEILQKIKQAKEGE